nr:hypothetical protein [uncultured Agathobacter sp.]
MKSKIVRRLGAMLLAGAMLVTSGNVTTYAAEQTDESVEVEETPENENLDAETQMEDSDFIIEDDESQDELYGAYRKDRQKLEEGDGYLICKEIVNGDERIVAHLFVDDSETDRKPDEILKSILSYKFMDENSIVALTTRYRHITIPKSVVMVLKEKNMRLGIVTAYYDSYEYDELYFDDIDVSDSDNSFRFQYDTNTELLDKLSNIGIDGYTFTISNDENNKKSFDPLYGKGMLNQAKFIDRNLCSKNINNDNIRLYYYDTNRDKYILLNSDINYKNSKLITYRTADGVKYTTEDAAIKASMTNINYYGEYFVCNSKLPDSMVFNLTGLEKSGDNLLYYKNGLRDTSYTGLCDYNGNTYYVKNGTVDYSANMLYDYNGSTWNIKNGKVDKTESVTMNNGSLVYTKDGKTSNETTLCKYNGEWYYIHNGKVDYNANTLCKYNGSWWYVQNGKVNFKYNGLCKFNGSWWYVSGGRVNFNATGLCKYNGSWWYVSGGRVNFNATGLCKYNGSWWYVSGGRVNFNATGLCKYNGSWWYVSSGKVNFNATGLCKYNGSWWYVSSGKVNFNATGLCKYNGNWFYVENGAVKFKNTLCKYNGTWWYINNGVVNFSKTTLCKYGKNWYAVSKGKVAWNYTGYMNYNGKNYKVVKGIVKF